MMISGKSIQGIIKTYGQRPKTGEVARDKGQASASTEKDKMTISEEGRIFQLALKAVKEAPDIREAKVEALKKAIKEGTYKISDAEIAQKMLRQSQNDDGIE